MFTVTADEKNDVYDQGQATKDGQEGNRIHYLGQKWHWLIISKEKCSEGQEH